VFLHHPEVQQLPNEEAASLITAAAVDSGSLALPAPAFVARSQEAAIISLPDSLGILLFDLSAPPGTSPIELTRWNFGTREMRVYWHDDECGVLYVTLGADGTTRAHFILLRRAATGWEVAWNADESPDWWFNAHNASVTVAADLTEVRVTGEALNTTLLFDEYGSVPRRTFTLTWHPDGAGFEHTPSVSAYGERYRWLWEVAEPGPYATLVEFLERLILGDEPGLAPLVTRAAVIDQARALDLDTPQRRYVVTAMTQDDPAITFGDAEGSVTVQYADPTHAGGPWRISSLRAAAETRSP
jgi:hypothetical protein